MLLTLDEGYLLTAALPDLQLGIAPLGPLHPRSHGSLDVGLVLPAAAPGLGLRGMGYLLSSPPLISDSGYLLLAALPDLGCRVALLGRSCAVAAWHSRPLPLTSDVG